MAKILNMLLAALLLTLAPQLAAPVRAAGETMSEDRQPVYGWELMSEQERQEHQARMRSLHTEEERERYRMEHHEQMRERAERMGVTLPESPMQRGMGRGAGPGGMSGMGMGRGGGGSRR